jgi:hypothetical protein
MMRSKFTAGALAAVLALGLAACGDDGGGDEASPEAAGATTTAPAAGLAPEACDAYVQLAGAVANVPEGPDAGAYIESDILPVVQTLQEAGGDQIAEQTDTLVEIATASVDDPSGFEAEEGQQAFSEIGGIVHEGCGYAQQDVTGVEYEFQGIPDTLDAGTTSFSFTNGGSEEHEMVMFRKVDGETRSFEELLALPEDQAESAVEFQTATFSPIGETTYAIADLAPGEYATVCFIPVGGAEDGPPHFTRGMISEFSVS